MSIFGSIMSKIFNSAVAAVEGTTSAPSPSARSTPAAAQLSASAASAAPSTPPEPVDVEAVLTGMASQKGGGGTGKVPL